MTASGFILMLAVWGVILANTGYCFYKLLTSERQLQGDDES